MPQLRFKATDPTVILVGAVFRAEDASTPQNALLALALTAGRSDPFTVTSPGAYRYEFNIHGSATFSLSLAEDPGGAAVTCFSGPFDPQDPNLGAGAAIDRRSFFVV